MTPAGLPWTRNWRLRLVALATVILVLPAVTALWHPLVAFGLLIIILIGLLIATVVSFPSLVERLDEAGNVDLVVRKARNDVRSALLQGFGSVLLLGGAFVAFSQLRTSQQELQATSLGQQTERFSRAVDQLEATTGTGVRLGGIFTLVALAHQEAAQRPVIAQILASYVQRNAAAPSTAPQGAGNGALPLQVTKPDIQACLDFLTEQTSDRQILSTLLLDRVSLPGLKLSGPDGARLDDARLRGADLTVASIENGHLARADLEGTMLPEVALTGADLHLANLVLAKLMNAVLTGANLAGADLTGANLNGATLAGTNLTNAKLVGADLSSVQHLDGNLTWIHREVVVEWG